MHDRSNSWQGIPLHHMLWAKTDRSDEHTHALICHLIDVAAVTRALWDTALTSSMRNQLCNPLGLETDQAGRLLAFWAGLHDLGKASPAFQRLYERAKVLLEEKGLDFPRIFVRKACYHGTITARTLGSALEKCTNLARRPAARIARALGGHHGAWPIPGEMRKIRSTQLGGEEWNALRHRLTDDLVYLFHPPHVESLGGSLVEENTFLTLFSGLTVVADWIGSASKYFPYQEAPIDLQKYAQRSARQAHRALAELGWDGWEPPRERASFQALFPRYTPYPMQQKIIELGAGLEGPAMVIIEAPTGSGKTEAALTIADQWAEQSQQQGTYIGMPTRATSNQMFGRFTRMLRHRYPGEVVNAQLIHGQARWSDNVRSLQLTSPGDEEAGAVVAMQWFLPRKRSLLAPFGVGTVDQAFLSILQTRHFFLRLFGLSHKTIIFDEVHAYDTYMNALFYRLLRWLRAAGTSVIILSATLPAKAREALLGAYAGTTADTSPDVTYPAVSWATEGQVGTVPLQAPENRTVTLEWLQRSPEAIADLLAHRLKGGGCAAVICNRVRRSQEVYRALKKAQIVPKENLILFHARFPSVRRDDIEERVLSNFGKDPEDRPHKAIVVATQVIEQSLDLDFDLMISDHAPVDLLLQRAGRLHRHQRPDRPNSLSRPHLLVTKPALKDGLPDFGYDARVYEEYILLRSYITLRDRDNLALPGDTETLIEDVYGPEASAMNGLPDGWMERLKKTKEDMERTQRKEVSEARKRLVPPPEDERLLSMRNPMLAEEDPTLHRAYRALTRLGRPSISLVCLHRTANEVTLDREGEGTPVDLSKEPDAKLTEKLAKRAVSVSSYYVVKHFRGQEAPPGWREHPLLRHYRAAIFVNGRCSLDDTPRTLRLTPEYGLEIERKGK